MVHELTHAVGRDGDPVLPLLGLGWDPDAHCAGGYRRLRGNEREGDDRLGVGDRAAGDQAEEIGEGYPLDGHVLLLRALPIDSDLREAGRQEDHSVLVGEPGRVVHLGENLECSTSEARLLRELAPAVPSSPSPATSRMPGGDLEEPIVDGGPELAHTDHVAVVGHGITATQPGWCTTSRSNVAPSGPRTRRRRGSARALVEDALAERLEDRGVAAQPATALQRGSDKPGEQRMRTVRPALELGVGLRPDPERVVRRAR